MLKTFKKANNKIGMNKLETFKNKAISIYDSKYSYHLIDRYINNKTKVPIWCNTCNEIFLQRPDNHIGINRYGCPICAGNKPLGLEKALDKAVIKHENKYNYSLITEYKNEKDAWVIICPYHGEFKQTAKNHMNGKGCPACSIYKTGVTIEMLTKNGEEIHGNKYSYHLIAEIQNNKAKLPIWCNNCEKIFEQSYVRHITGKCGCPTCNNSKGETKIKSWLDLNLIVYEKEKTFEGLLSDKGYKLRFDFYLPKFNILIEYDGEQHFDIVNFNGHKGSQDQLDRIKFNDEIKNEYCFKNNINLLRIPYTIFKGINRNDKLKTTIYGYIFNTKLE